MDISKTPFGVTNFERLMYASIVFSLLEAALYWQTLSEVFSNITAFDLAWFYGLQCLFIWLVARKRKNWPRWILLALFILEFIPPHKHFSVSSPIFFDMLEYTSTITGLGLALIFASNEWFQQVENDSLPLV
jgi:hypothetical protein